MRYNAVNILQVIRRRVRHTNDGKDGKEHENLAQVIVKPGEGIDAALRRFKKQTMESGILKEARAHEHYEKPSDKRRREAAARLRKIAKAKRQAEGREAR